jgi:excisionase family DNA binding protein
MPQSRELMDRIATEVFRGVVVAIQGVLRGDQTPTATAAAPPESDVMNADEVAAFLGVDRTTVYDFAGRGVIPHQRLGKRLLFRRGALVSWLDSSLCKATSARKAG